MQCGERLERLCAVVVVEDRLVAEVIFRRVSKIAPLPHADARAPTMACDHKSSDSSQCGPISSGCDNRQNNDAARSDCERHRHQREGLPALSDDVTKVQDVTDVTASTPTVADYP